MNFQKRVVNRPTPPLKETFVFETDAVEFVEQKQEEGVLCKLIRDYDYIHVTYRES